MKKLLTFLIIISTVLISLPAQASWEDCVVYNEKDNKSGGTINFFSLRKKINLFNSGVSEAVCEADSIDSAVGYTQGIYFMTDEWDSGNYYANHVEDSIVLKQKLSFKNSEGLSLVIGNWSLTTLPSELMDFGQVTIDASGLKEDEIFYCGTKNTDGKKQPDNSITLRNIKLIVPVGTTTGDLSESAPCVDLTYATVVDSNGDSVSGPAGTDNDGDGVDVEDGDCNDSNASVYPGATEACDGVDNDCDGTIDDGVTYNQYGMDADGDLAYDENTALVEACTIPEGTYIVVTTDTVLDCNDADASINYNAIDYCDNGLDENCDGEADDEYCTPPTESPELYTDDDGDGYCEADSCTGDEIKGGDCNDDATLGEDGETPLGFNINPGIDETSDEACSDAVDNDCDGGTDGVVSNTTGTTDTGCADYSDVDQDGDGYTTNEGDCDDTDATSSPGKAEVCGNDVDNDCDTISDANETVCVANEKDDDGDGFCEDANADLICDDGTAVGDCNDADDSVYPGAGEVCGDEIDNACTGTADYGCEGSADVDDDGDGLSENQGDCNDDPQLDGVDVYPGAVEMCGDSIDNDCNGEGGPSLADEAECTLTAEPNSTSGCTCDMSGNGEHKVRPYAMIMIIGMAGMIVIRTRKKTIL